MERDYIKDRRILLVDDEPGILELVGSVLRQGGFGNVYAAGGAEEAVKLAARVEPELAILDLMLPDGDGFELMLRLRENGDLPVLFLTARGEDSDRLKGLGLGADDYIVKPFLPQELLFRVAAVLRRSYRGQRPLVCLSASKIDLDRAEVIKDGERLPLTAKEYELLKALYRGDGRIVTVDALCQALWGDNPYGYENSLMAHVRRVREKIEADPSRPVSLITVKGLGYRLITREETL